MEHRHKLLKEKHRAVREFQSEEVSLRIHRALSWLDAAEKEEQIDIKFILYWVSFNSIYGRELEYRHMQSERSLFCNFYQKLIDFDSKNLIYNIVWDNYSNIFRVFVDNKYVFRPFWDFKTGLIEENKWIEKFEKSRGKIQKALASKDTVTLLNVLFDRLYVLRNQLMHGGATWKSKLNRPQLKNGMLILEKLIPEIIELVMDNHTEDWGVPAYPPLE